MSACSKIIGDTCAMVRVEVVSQKVALIKDHLDRVKSQQDCSLEQFLKDRDRQDIVCFNLYHAIQACMDLASHIVSDEGWGLPSSYREMAEILVNKQIISDALGKNLKEMIGFRNRLAHEYAKIDFEEVYKIMQKHLPDIEKYIDAILSFSKI